MRKIVLFSGIIAIVFGIIAAIIFGTTQSEHIIAYDISDDKMFTIADYWYGDYLNISSTTGAETAVRLPDDGVLFRDIQAYKNNVYVMSVYASSCIVDKYDFSGKYIERQYTFEIPENSSLDYYSLDIFDNSKYYESQVDYLLEAVFIINGREVIRQPIAGSNNIPERYILAEDASAVWASFISNRLFYMNDVNELYAINDNNKPIHLDLGDAVPYQPFTASYTLHFTDLRTITLKEITFWDLFFEENFDESQILDDDHAYLYDDEIYYNNIDENITFADLRNVKTVYSDFWHDYAGVYKKEGERGSVYILSAVFDIQKYDEYHFSSVQLLLISVIVTAGIFIIILLLLLLIRWLLSIRKIVIKQMLLCMLVNVVVLIPSRLAFEKYITTIINDNIAYVMSDFLWYINEEIDSDEFAANGLSPEMYQKMADFEKHFPERLINNSQYKWMLALTEQLTINAIEIARIDSDNVYRYEYYTNLKSGSAVSYFLDEERIALFENASENEIMITNSDQHDVEWLEITSFLYDSTGSNVGFIQICLNCTMLNDAMFYISILMSTTLCSCLTLIMVLFIITSAHLLSPLKKIKAVVSEIAEGKIGATVVIKSNDELQDIAYSFSEMSTKLSRYFDSINVISKAYERYLPKGFFGLMDKKTVLDVKSGDQIELPLTYLFIGIFQKNNKTIMANDLSDSSTNSFSMLNDIYSIVSDSLPEYGGVIESFSERQITIMFPTNANAHYEAVEAALAVQEKLTVCRRDTRTTHFTFTVQYGNSTIGVIGTEQAMKCISISKAIEIQPYISEIMKRFELNFVITDEALTALKSVNLQKHSNDNTNISYRYIGRILQLLDHTETSIDDKNNTKLYEIIDGNSEQEKRLKTTVLAQFEQAISAYEAHDYKSARNSFINVLRVNRCDLLAKYYLLKIENALSESEITKDE